MFELLSLRTVYGFVFLILFAYLERLVQGGLVAAAIMAAGLFYTQRSWLALVIVIAESYFHFFGPKLWGYVAFIALQLLSLFSPPVGALDKVTSWKPYEKKIRALLLEKNPSLLHRVDQWLDEYKGKESKLWEHLLEMLDDDESSSSSQSAGQRIPASSDDNYRGHQQSQSSTGTRSPAEKIYGGPTLTASSSAVVIEHQIRELLATHNPSALNHLERLLRDFRGQEHELLRRLRVEFGLPSSSIATATATTGTAAAAPGGQKQSVLTRPASATSVASTASSDSSSPQLNSHDIEVLENARWEARQAIQKRMAEAVRQVNQRRNY